eukprot:TRINITY_DN21890_c0_g2_i1.p2 TRINITY_DN21890_c0_g2~~TRINITY_DN21890_c0_g2_i1.p2  ORF type:complete len:266 (+),score=72.06 TRINITY_DN21890_c0_g2_i1:94-798(+)
MAGTPEHKAPDWKATWDDIISGGSQRWKDGEREHCRMTLELLRTRFGADVGPLRVLVPLSGDTPLCVHLWQAGHTVTAMELIPEACAALRATFPGEWTERTEGPWTIWELAAGRMQIWQGSIFDAAAALEGQHDVVVDKDSWGAVGRDTLPDYTRLVAGYLRPGGWVYLEAIQKDDPAARLSGPPWHTETAPLADSWKPRDVTLVEELGEPYTLTVPGMRRLAWVLRKKPADGQ